MKLQLIGILACVSSAICFAAVHFAESGDENKFARQLHGEWVKCAPDYYPQPRVTNGIFLVEAITFRTNGVAEWMKSAVRKTGRYSVKFERPPARGASTFGRISLTAEDGQSNTWTRVNFGQDNRFPSGDGFLRIEGPAVYQVFRRGNSRTDGSANGSQPIRSETSRRSAAAGSDP